LWGGLKVKINGFKETGGSGNSTLTRMAVTELDARAGQSA